MGHVRTTGVRIALAASSLLWACNGSLEDELVVEAGIPGDEVVVYADCDACDAQVPVELYFDPEAFVAEDASVVFEQYRIDYDLRGLRSGLPYFADEIRQTVTPTDSLSVSLDVVGATQRSVLRQRRQDDELEGEGTITLAGYDSDDERVVVSAHFPIRVVFGEAAGTEETSP